MQAAGWVKQVIDPDKPRRVFLDVGGVGAGIYDRLAEMGYGEIVRDINFGSAPFEPPPRDAHGRPSGGAANRRAEMWMKSKRLARRSRRRPDPGLDALQADACGPGYGYDSNTRLLLERKDDMRAAAPPAPTSGTPWRSPSRSRWWTGFRAGRAGWRIRTWGSREGVLTVARLERSDSRDGPSRISLRSMRATDMRPTMLRPTRVSNDHGLNLDGSPAV